MAMVRRSFKPGGFQRTITSMFSNWLRPRARRPRNIRPVPLMEYLNRKSEKRSSVQGCVAEAGLTLEVRERLASSRKNDNIRSNDRARPARSETFHNSNSIESSCVTECTWPFQRGTIPLRDHGDGIRQFESVEEECSTSSYQDEIAMSKAQADAQARDRSRNRVRRAPPRLEIFSRQGGSISAVDASSCYSTNVNSEKLDGHHVPETPQSRGVVFIDLTEDEVDSGGGNCLGGEDVNTATFDHRKKKRRSQAEPGATEICPVCDELFPPHMMHTHVESELDPLEMSETDAVPEAHDDVPAGRHELPQPDDAEWSAELNEPRIRFSSWSYTNVLVLGDETKHRRQRNSGSHNKRPLNRSATTFKFRPVSQWGRMVGRRRSGCAVGSVSVWEGLRSKVLEECCRNTVL